MHSVTDPIHPSWQPDRTDRILGPAMFGASILFLVLAAGLIHRVGLDDPEVLVLEELIIVRGILCLWPIFWIDGIARFFCRAGQMSVPARFVVLALVSVFPPMRLAGRSYQNPEYLWLPGLGWRHVDRHLRRQLERVFGVPMIVVAFLVLPLLSVEYFWSEEVRTHFGLGLFVDIGNSVVWSVFTVEFIVMMSVADKKLRYALANWMDLAVVVLPLIDFLPILRLFRLTRVLQLQQVGRLGRMYRLRGLLLKLWRAILVLKTVQRFFGGSPTKRLKELRELLIVREEELIELRKEIHDLERQIAQSEERKKVEMGGTAQEQNVDAADR